MWRGEDDEILIDFVKNNEILFNVKCKEFRQNQLKQNLWNEIAPILQRSGWFKHKNNN